MGPERRARGRGARRPRPAARRGRPRRPAGSGCRCCVQPAPLCLSVHKAGAGQGGQGWLLPEAVSLPPPLNPGCVAHRLRRLVCGMGAGGGRSRSGESSEVTLLVGLGSASELPDATDQFHFVRFLCASWGCGRCTPMGALQGWPAMDRGEPSTDGAPGQHGVWCLRRGGQRKLYRFSTPRSWGEVGDSWK